MGAGYSMMNDLTIIQTTQVLCYWQYNVYFHRLCLLPVCVLSYMDLSIMHACMSTMWEIRSRDQLLPWAVAFIMTTTAIYSLEHRLHTMVILAFYVPVTVKWISAFRLSNNKWQWWMWMVAAYSWNQLAWFEGQCLHNAVPTFIKWSGWTLIVAVSDNSTVYIGVIIAIITI